MPSSLLGAHPAAASGGETPDETKPDKEGWDKPGDDALSFKDRTTLRSTSKSRKLHRASVIIDTLAPPHKGGGDDAVVGESPLVLARPAAGLEAVGEQP